MSNEEYGRRKLPTARHVPSPDEESELHSFHRRAAESAGYSMENTDAFDTRGQYAQNFPGDLGPEQHLSRLIRNAEKQTQDAIDLGRKGAKQ